MLMLIPIPPAESAMHTIRSHATTYQDILIKEVQLASIASRRGGSRNVHYGPPRYHHVGMKFRLWMTRDDRREEIKISSSLRPSTRSDSVIPLSVKHDLRSKTRLRNPCSGNFPRCDVWTRRYRQNSPVITSENDFFLVESLSPHHPCRFEPTTVRTYYPQGKFKLPSSIYTPCHSICGYTHTRPSDLRCYPTTPSASPPPSPFLIPFLFSFLPFVTPFLLLPPFSCCFLSFYSLILFQTVYFFCTCDIQFHTSPHHPSIHPIHTHIHLPTSSIYVH
jgi:hypothetical protein